MNFAVMVSVVQTFQETGLDGKFQTYTCSVRNINWL
jgi:hypothetical protein